MSENDPDVVELDVYVERDGAESHVGAIELPLRDQEKWREVEGNLVRGQVVEVTREAIGRALLGLTDDDEQALEALPGKLEEAAEEHAREWMVERGSAHPGQDRPIAWGSWRRAAMAAILARYQAGTESTGPTIDQIESILLWPKGADL